MSGPPPPRYRVVERGRRLEVIDLHAKTPAKPAPALLPRQTRFDGGGELTTRAFYDDKGPRTIPLDAGSTAMIGRLKLIAIVATCGFVVAAIAMPFLIPLPFALTNPKVRAALRKPVTRWLDARARGMLNRAQASAVSSAG